MPGWPGSSTHGDHVLMQRGQAWHVERSQLPHHPSHRYVCHMHPLRNRGPGLLCFSSASCHQSSILAILGPGWIGGDQQGWRDPRNGGASWLAQSVLEPPHFVGRHVGQQ